MFLRHRGMRRGPHQQGGVQLVTLLIVIAVIGGGVTVGSRLVGSHFGRRADESGDSVPILGGGGRAGSPPATPTASEVPAAPAMASTAMLVQSAGTVEAPPAPQSPPLWQSALSAVVSFLIPSAQAATPNLDTPKIRELTGRWGVRPRVYAGLWKGDNAAEQRFLDALPEVTRFLNERLAKSGSPVRVTEAEVATNFLAEGAIVPLSKGDPGPYHSFSVMGLDSLVTNYAALKPWLHDSVVREVATGWRGTVQNEKKQNLEVIHFLGMEPGMYASGGMYVWSKMQATRDLAARGVKMSDLPQEAQVYWSTIYFNAGPALGRRTLDQYGVDDYKVPWSGGESLRYHFNQRYNARWRTGTFELLQHDVYARKKP